MLIGGGRLVDVGVEHRVRIGFGFAARVGVDLRQNGGRNCCCCYS